MQTLHLEVARVREDGDLVDGAVTLSSVRNVAGEIIGAAAVGHDITAQKAAERALRESEERFRRVFDDSPNRAG
jgi:two-component system, sporulation sensor kinase A